jgi:hypothetical protein
MLRIFAFLINILIITISTLEGITAQDTLHIPVKMSFGIDVAGPANYFFDKNNLNIEGYFGVDRNEKISYVFSGGFTNYDYTSEKFSYHTNGIFFRTGADFNILKPEKAMGIYWGGIGVHYGISFYNSEASSITYKDKYWGTIISSVPKSSQVAHFIEFTPGMRAQLIKNISIGWSISIRTLLYNTSGNDNRAVYLPGFGNGSKRFTTGLNYFIVFNIPYKKITVIKPKEVPEEPDTTPVNGQPPLNN